MTEEGTRIPPRRIYLPVYQPNLFHIRDVLQRGLSEAFTKVTVSVVKCPDLTTYPFYFTKEGLCENTEALEIGEMRKGLIIESVERTWEIPVMLADMHYAPRYIIGGSLQHKNSINNEYITNFMYLGLNSRNNSYAVISDARNHRMQPCKRLECNIPSNFFMSDGVRNMVLKVCVEQRKTNINFADAMHIALCRGYGEVGPVVLGGTFYVNNGIVKHEVTLRKLAPIDSIFYPYISPFHEVQTPLIGVGTVYGFKSYGNYRFRGQRFYTVSTDGSKGGLYCGDCSPKTTEYMGYFNVAGVFYCADVEQL